MRDLEANYDFFASHDTEILGVNVNPQPSKRVWAETLCLSNLNILSDFKPLGEASKAYGVWQEHSGTSGRVVVLVGPDGTALWSRKYEDFIKPDIKRIRETISQCKMQKIRETRERYLICTPFIGQTSREGISVKYSCEFKKECTQLYRQGKWPGTPGGIEEENLHAPIKERFRLEELHGPEILNHENNIRWAPDEELEMVSKALIGNSVEATTIENRINEGQLHLWLNKHKKDGYSGLVNRRKGRKSKNTTMKKKNIHKPKELNESEREELIRLGAENEYMKAENEIIKKEITLREERYAAQLKAKK